MFITLEGLDFCGKTTIAKALKARLEQEGKQVVLTREPGGTPIAEKIRTILLDKENAAMTDETEALLYAASRAQHYAEKILPALKEGKIVICDRWLGSSLAYQGWARSLGVDAVKMINDFGIRGARPDFQFYIDVPLEVRRQRAIARGGDKDRLELQSAEFFALVEQYFKIDTKNSDYGVLIDGTKSVDDIVNDIMNCLQ